MNTETKSAHVSASGRLFKDLGFETGEAAKLKAETDEMIASRLSPQRELIGELRDWVVSHELSDAAQILGISSQRLAGIIQGEDENLSIDTLVSLLLRAGRRIEFRVE